MLKHNLLICVSGGRRAACTTAMIAPVRPPKRPTRSPVVERARHLLTATFWPPDAEPANEILPAGRRNRWKAWLFGGLLIAVALWLGYIAVAATF